MISTFMMRKEIQGTETSSLPTLTKVKKMLRVAKQAEKLSVAFAGIGINHLARGEKTAAVRFARASRRMSRFADETRRRARKVLAETSRPLSYGYGPRDTAVPRWQTSEL